MPWTIKAGKILAEEGRKAGIFILSCIPATHEPVGLFDRQWFLFSAFFVCSAVNRSFLPVPGPNARAPREVAFHEP